MEGFVSVGIKDIVQHDCRVQVAAVTTPRRERVSALTTARAAVETARDAHSRWTSPNAYLLSVAHGHEFYRQNGSLVNSAITRFVDHLQPLIGGPDRGNELAARFQL